MLEKETHQQDHQNIKNKQTKTNIQKRNTFYRCSISFSANDEIKPNRNYSILL